MDTEQILEALQDASGQLISKRCTYSYLTNNNIISHLDHLVPVEFGSISERIYKLKYGGGYCEVCGTRTNKAPSGKGFARFCRQHFHTPKKHKQSECKKHIDIDLVRHLYLDRKLSIDQIATHLGDISNVTLKKRMVEAGIEIRQHSENQKLFCKRGHKAPRIVIDRRSLIDAYSVQKTPIPILARVYNCSEETIRRFLIQEGIERTNRRSSIEWLIIDILDRHQIGYRTNVKNVIAPFELDILIEQYNLAIEINGLYTHSYYRGSKAKNYHFNKYQICKEKGIRLIQLWENDIKDNLSIIESMILYRCKRITNSIAARSCTVGEFDYRSAVSFYNNNHIQGHPSKGVKTLALMHSGVPVCAIGYTKMKATTRIDRFCTLVGVSVPGGFSRLLSKLPRPIVTYSSNDISWGELYKNNGFELINQIKSDMWYTDYSKVYNRQLFMKHKLKHHPMILQFDPNKTEVANMLDNGFDVIYKSGVSTWRLL